MCPNQSKSPISKTAQTFECAYCHKEFSSRMKMQKHVIGETCLPKDKTLRWIVKFLTLEELSEPSSGLLENVDMTCYNNFEKMFDSEFQEFDNDNQFEKDLKIFDIEFDLFVSQSF
jgi:hypothetical protein